MQCPECDSHYTQAVPLAYRQSIRTGYNGHQSISEFGQELEPPQARSEVLVPMLYAVALFGVTFLLLPTEITWFDIEWPQLLLTSTLGRLAIAGAAAFSLLIYLSACAIADNLTDHAEKLDEWERTVVCRRCGGQFSR
jgi:hypothetical protein